MPYPINPVPRLLLEDGTSYLLLDEGSPRRITSQDASNTSATTSVTATYPATPTQNNTLIAAVYNSDPNASVTMSSGWLLAVGSDDTGGHSASIWYKVAGVAEATGVTASDASSGSMHIAIFEYKGLLSVSPKDQTASANSGAATANSQTTGTTSTTTQANELLFAAVAFAGSGSAPSWSNGFNAQLSTSRIFTADLLVSATGTYSSTVTVTGTAVKMAGAIATFKAIDNTTDKLVLDEATALDDPLTATSVSTTTPALDFVGQTLGGFGLSDPFNAVTLNTSKWTQFTAASGTCTYTANGASLNYPNPTSTSADADITSVSTFSLINRSATLEVTSAPSGPNSDATFKLKIDSTHDVHWQNEGTNLYAAYINGSQTILATLTYSPTLHRYWRIRESNGTVYWDTSEDNINWINRASVANPITLTALSVQMAATSFGVDANLSPFAFRNFNVANLTYEVEIDTVSTFDSSGTLNTGALSAGANSNDNSVGTLNWGTSQFLSAQDGSSVTASVIAGSTTQYLVASSFGFNIPLGATITGVVAEIYRFETGTGTMTDSNVKLLKGGVVSGTSLASGTPWTTSGAYFTYGSSSQLWGNSLTASDINASNFGVALSITNITTTSQASVDHVRMTVYYTTPLLDKTSDINTGFIDNTAGETADPFLLLEDGVSKLLLEDGTSRLVINEAYTPLDYVTYTPPSGTLTNGNTYYWRVRNKVQNSGAYGAWSEIRSFTVSSGSVITKTQAAIARIANSVTKTQNAVARIATNPTKTQTAISRIANIVTKTQGAIARVANTRTLTQPAIAHITSVVTKTQSSIARIATSLTKTQSAISRIANAVTKTQTAISRIATNRTLTQGALARIQKVVTATQPATARIQRLLTKTQSAISRISNSRTLTQSAIARVAQIVTKTQSSIARIATVRTLTQGAIARVASSVTKTQSATARIQRAVTKTQSAVANIINSTTISKTQTATARIQRLLTSTQTAIARISAPLTKTQSAIARVANNLTKTQAAVARIAKIITKTQPSVARIAKTVTKTQSATANIVVVKNYSKGSPAALPTNDNNLTAFNSTDYSNVTSNDSSWDDNLTSSPNFSVFQFKNLNANNTDPINVQWIGKTDYAPATSTVYLQIYNRTTPAWETLSSNNSAAINTDFTLNGSQVTGLSNYYDSNNIVSCRVYQEIT